ncbi:hypothetical protein MAR_004697 [Mya arenaria]|uniref:Uncharacterized protein n=1 Tax=Mya arenaria TaxID=6604 RepID=A0ABY7F0G7_MYAAR|nr:hypothetical protein MAR_004697 [Mya arenaria]
MYLKQRRNQIVVNVTMKIVLLLLVLLPIAFSVEVDKRFFLPDAIHIVCGLLGADATEAQCESLCHSNLPAYLTPFCGTACHAIQSGAHTC